MVEVRCVGCEALVPGGEGPSHPYMVSAAGCWERYCSLEEWKSCLGGEELIGIVQDLVDCFAVQHATSTDRRNVQSVAVHLMSLCSEMERGVTGRQRRARIGRWVGRDYPVLDPRPAGYLITISDVATAPPAVMTWRISRCWRALTNPTTPLQNGSAATRCPAIGPSKTSWGSRIARNCWTSNRSVPLWRIS
jgi:hypothetical protein